MGFMTEAARLGSCDTRLRRWNIAGRRRVREERDLRKEAAVLPKESRLVLPSFGKLERAGLPFTQLFLPRRDERSSSPWKPLSHGPQ